MCLPSISNTVAVKKNVKWVSQLSAPPKGSLEMLSEIRLGSLEQDQHLITTVQLSNTEFVIRIHFFWIQ